MIVSILSAIFIWTITIFVWMTLLIPFFGVMSGFIYFICKIIRVILFPFIALIKLLDERQPDEK